MTVLSDLVIFSVVISAVGIALFYLYYKVSSNRETMEEMSQAEGYDDTGSYFRDKLAGRSRPASWSVALKPPRATRIS